MGTSLWVEIPITDSDDIVVDPAELTACLPPPLPSTPQPPAPPSEDSEMSEAGSNHQDSQREGKRPRRLQPWARWNSMRIACDSNVQLGVVLRLTADVPSVRC